MSLTPCLPEWAAFAAVKKSGTAQCDFALRLFMEAQGFFVSGYWEVIFMVRVLANRDLAGAAT